PLVGRARELALLERHLAGEGPPVLLVAGEPGIGKTRLLQEAAARAAGTGWCVLQGGCSRRGGQEPYAPVLGALEWYIRGHDPIHLRTTLQGCAWLVRLLPELADGPIEPLPAWTLPPEQERRLIVRAVGRFLANAALQASHDGQKTRQAGCGVLLVLDDLQWASADALELLVALVRTIPELPLRVLSAYRDSEIGPDDPF